MPRTKNVYIRDHWSHLKSSWIYSKCPNANSSPSLLVSVSGRSTKKHWDLSSSSASWLVFANLKTFCIIKLKLLTNGKTCIWVYIIDTPTVYALCRYPFGFILLTVPRCIPSSIGMYLGLYYWHTHSVCPSQLCMHLGEPTD